jgi:signal transduction histidine kinase
VVAPSPIASARLVALVSVLLCTAPSLAAAQTSAAPAVRQVLLLQSFDRGNLVIDNFTGNFRADLDQLAGGPVNVVQIVIGPTGFVVAPEHEVVDYVTSTYANRPKPDQIIAVGGPAALFARKYRRELFPDVPLLFASVDQRFLRGAPPAANEIAVTVTNDFPGVVDDILQLLPQTRQVFMVTGSGPLGKFWKRELEEPLKRFHDRLTFTWSDDLSLPEILRRCAILPANSAIFYLTFGADAAGGAYADERALADLHAIANAPIFGAFSPLLSHGIVGGRLLSMGDLSRSTAEVSARLLAGAVPSSIEAVPHPPRRPMFDWRELQRWGIPESRLPAGSVVQYRRPTLWEEYRLTVLAAVVVLAVQMVLIAGLLYQRRERQRAETENRANLSLAADVSRRETMAALTNSITHELGQPLGSMLSNAHALQRMVAADQATPDAIGEILSDIRAQGVQASQIIERHRTMLGARPLERREVDLRDVINQSLALVAHDLRRRQIAVNVELSYVPCVTMGDQVLLQQVLVNVLVNAMDAMAQTPPGRRQLTIRSEARATEVEVSVRDNGTGLPADAMLFTPFVTTKSKGLGIGLTIARTIVDAYGGAINGRNNPQGGAIFTVTLPRRESAAVSSGAA